MSAEERERRGAGALVGAYRLIRRLGAGGMGEVWLAEHTRLCRSAAIKLLHSEYAARPEVITRFFNEARAATSIRDPGIVQIFDFDHAGADGAYIAMELLEGESLDARCRRLRVLPVEMALRVVRQVAGSLGAAHARGIVHRDLKPENIFLVRDPEVGGGERTKILDFGIAKLMGDGSIKTQTSALMGTPTFMSPEQCRGAGLVDQRSDVYSLGCVLFALVAGRPPFRADGVGELLMKHMVAPAPRLSSVVPDVSPALDDLVARCLDKEPDARFASGAELAAALLALGELAGGPGSRQPSTAPRPVGELGVAPTLPPDTTASGAAAGAATTLPPDTTLSGSAASVSRPAPPRRRARARIAVAASLAASLAAVTLVVARGSSPVVARGSSPEAQLPAAQPRLPDAAPGAALGSAPPPRVDAPAVPAPAPPPPVSAPPESMIDAAPPAVAEPEPEPPASGPTAGPPSRAPKGRGAERRLPLPNRSGPAASSAAGSASRPVPGIRPEPGATTEVRREAGPPASTSTPVRSGAGAPADAPANQCPLDKYGIPVCR